jgi:hypothetical protein
MCQSCYRAADKKQSAAQSSAIASNNEAIKMMNFCTSTGFLPECSQQKYFSSLHRNEHKDRE